MKKKQVMMHAMKGKTANEKGVKSCFFDEWMRHFYEWRLKRAQGADQADAYYKHKRPSKLTKQGVTDTQELWQVRQEKNDEEGLKKLNSKKHSSGMWDCSYRPLTIRNYFKWHLKFRYQQDWLGCCMGKTKMGCGSWGKTR